MDEAAKGLFPCRVREQVNSVQLWRTEVGIVSTCAGVTATLLCMLFFALYHHYLQQAEKDQ
jgi:hypothetical protein